jgi:thiol-disulfide isomerase/thioredoxin
MMLRLLQVILCTAFFCAISASGAELKPWKAGKTPPLALKDLQGQIRSLDQFRGKVLVVNFWATWCEPCVAEMPSLQKLKTRYADRIEVVGVNLGEGEARIRPFIEKTGVSFPILLDRDGDARKLWKVNGVPSTFVMGTDGRVRYSIVGEVDFDDKEVASKIIALFPKH